jgi:chromosome partitioning protein
MQRGLILSFLQAKGGVGKSTITENVAVAFAHDKAKVKIIDCDIRQRTSSKWTARRNEYHLDKPQIVSSIQADDLRRAVIEDAKNYDVTIIDVQGRDSKSLRTALLISDIVYIPFIPSQNDIETIEELSELLEETQAQNHPRETFYILNNCSSHYLDKSAQDAKDFLQEYSSIIQQSSIKLSHRKVYKSAALEGIGVIEADDEKAKQEILSLKKEIKKYA